PSLSAFAAYGVTKEDLTARKFPHDTFIFKSWDHEESYQDMLEGHPAMIMLNTPTVVDPSLAPDGEHIAVFTAPVAYDIGRSWEQEQDRFLEETLDLCERHLPGFVGGVEILAVSTPHAFQRFTLNEDGAMVGWATTPDQSGSRRLSNLTPIEGLY